MSQKIYLDYAATTPIDPKVFEAMLPYLKEDFGNPSALYGLGKKALSAVEVSRKIIADFLNCDSGEIIFTGSATEANNLAIKGLLLDLKYRFPNIKPHVIISQIEHHAVLNPCRSLEKEGVEVSYLLVGKEGLINVSDIEKTIKNNTVLVSIMYANNEIGTIQPIAEIGRLIKKINSSNNRTQKIYFHTDAVQAINYLDCDVKSLGIDLLTLSSHKIYGPKGVGAIFIKKETPIDSLIDGGGQEFGLRSGTENVAGIVGLGVAIEEIHSDSFGDSSPKFRTRGVTIKILRDKLVNGILKNIPNSDLNGSEVYRLPHNANLSFEGAEGEDVVIALAKEGIAASAGSACASKAMPSYVLLALGLSGYSGGNEARCSVRMTLGKYTTEEEIDYVLRVLPEVIERQRRVPAKVRKELCC